MSPLKTTAWEARTGLGGARPNRPEIETKNFEKVYQCNILRKIRNIIVLQHKQALLVMLLFVKRGNGVLAWFDIFDSREQYTAPTNLKASLLIQLDQSCTVPHGYTITFQNTSCTRDIYTFCYKFIFLQILQNYTY